jgi:hypothetical protein
MTKKPSIHPLIRACCGNGDYYGRYRCDVPFVIGKYIYGTDRAIVARIAWEGQAMPATKLPPVDKPPVDKLRWTRSRYSANPFVMPDDIPPFEPVVCPRCNGVKLLRFRCAECNGAGKVDPDVTPVGIGGLTLSNKHLLLLRKHHATLYANKEWPKTHPIYFTAPGGVEGLLMTMSRG